jgi:hypothetical protein
MLLNLDKIQGKLDKAADALSLPHGYAARYLLTTFVDEPKGRDEIAVRAVLVTPRGETPVRGLWDYRCLADLGLAVRSRAEVLARLRGDALAADRNEVLREIREYLAPLLPDGWRVQMQEGREHSVIWLRDGDVYRARGEYAYDEAQRAKKEALRGLVNWVEMELAAAWGRGEGLSCPLPEGGCESPCSACGGTGDGVAVTTDRDTVGGHCRACNGRGEAPSSPLPPLRFTDGSTPNHHLPMSPYMDIFDDSITADLLEAQVASESRQGVVYTVTADATGWHCTCPGHRHYGSRCKHIRRLAKSPFHVAPSIAD